MKLTSSSTARRRTANALLRSFGGPQMPSPVRRIAPKPRRCTEICPPSEPSPAKLAESSLLFMIVLQDFSLKQITYCTHASAVQLPAPVIPNTHSHYVLLAKPLRVSVGAVETVTRFIKCELPSFRGGCSFRQKRGQLRRIHGLKTAGCVQSLLENRQRIAAGDYDTGGKSHRIVQALHRSGCFALENDAVTHRLHTENA